MPESNESKTPGKAGYASDEDIAFAEGQLRQIYRLMRTDPDLVSDTTRVVKSELEGYLSGTPGPKAYDVFAGKACLLMGSCHILRAGGYDVNDLVATYGADILLEEARGYRKLALSILNGDSRF